MEGFRQCHIRDGFAIVRYFAWLEKQLVEGQEVLEYDGAMQLEEFRKYVAPRLLELTERDGKWYMGQSFDTISSSGPNAGESSPRTKNSPGAIIHYKPDEEGSAVIRRDQIYLCDTGGE